MTHLPHAHHETSKRDSPNETKIKEKTKQTIPDSNSNLTKSMTHHIQTKELTSSSGPSEATELIGVDTGLSSAMLNFFIRSFVYLA
jgi:hypothetical protein